MGIWADEQRADWRDEALCKGMNPDIFFPTRQDGPEVIDMAKGICRRCPVRTYCLAEAIDNNEKIGIWGGMSGRDMRTIQRETRHLTGEARLTKIRQAVARIEGK